MYRSVAFALGTTLSTRTSCHSRFASSHLFRAIPRSFMTTSVPVRVQNGGTSRLPRGSNVWTEFTGLANEHKAVNLGQGFPNFSPPEFVKQAAEKAASTSEWYINQYARSQGHVRLSKAISAKYSGLVNHQIDPLKEVLVTNGASGALLTVMLALLDQGDEVLIPEPFFDLYPAQVAMGGGVSKYVPLDFEDGQWKLSIAKLEAATTDRTKALILCNPHNPTGKVFSVEELEEIAEYSRRTGVVVVSDEVYEEIVFKPAVHKRIAGLPGMWDRTVTVCSAGKTFSATGWKIGWIYGPEALLAAMHRCNAYMTFSIATPLQEAVAEALEQADVNGYYDLLEQDYHNKRDHLVQTLREANMEPVVPDGQYFVMADISKIDFPYDAETSDVTRDWAFCRWLTREVGVTAIPPSAFYCKEHKHMAEKWARFAFCKTDVELEEARRRLQQYSRSK